jgi:hypothetical protein
MNTKHTPGPWHVQPIGSERYVEAQGPKMICDMQRNEASNPIELAEIDANAKLIAATPDLLEALQAMLLIGEHTDLMQGMRIDALFPKRFEAARAAIERATK